MEGFDELLHPSPQARRQKALERVRLQCQVWRFLLIAPLCALPLMFGFFWAVAQDLAVASKARGILCCVLLPFAVMATVGLLVTKAKRRVLEQQTEQT